MRGDGAAVGPAGAAKRRSLDEWAALLNAQRPAIRSHEVAKLTGLATGSVRKMTLRALGRVRAEAGRLVATGPGSGAEGAGSGKRERR